MPMSITHSHIVKPALDHIPPSIQYAEDYERIARNHISDAIWAYIQEGCDKPSSQQQNRQAFDRLKWLPRHFHSVHKGSAESHILGQYHPFPMLLAPIAYHGLVHPQAELAMAQAAAIMQTGFALSSLASSSIEQVAATFYNTAKDSDVEPAALWFQLYWQADLAENQRILQTAEAAGYTAIVWTVDAQYKRSAFSLPKGITAVNLADMAQEKVTSQVLDKHIVFQSTLSEHEADWTTLSWIKSHTGLPIIIKGILSPEEAVLAKQHGADAIIVSNHGGRVLADAVSPLQVLASIRERLNDPAFPLLMDSGIRSGADMAKALAMGADAVMIGRPQLYALAVAGALGVAHLIHLYRAELELAMAQLGCATLASLTQQAFWSAD